jgi:hypothetical protein
LIANTTAARCGGLLGPAAKAHLSRRRRRLEVALARPGIRLIFRAGIVLAVVLVLVGPPVPAAHLRSQAAAAAEMCDAAPVLIRQEPAAPPEARPGVLTAPDPLIRAMVDEVSPAAVWHTTAQLSGALPIIVGGAAYTLTTRHTASGTPLAKATQFVGEQLARSGYAVEYQAWREADHQGRNVIGQRPGLTRPAEIYIIGAHLDDMPREGLAPGADDNASGSAAVLIAAEIMSRYRWACTLRFALWTGEEQGFLGSITYADRAKANGEAIKGYLNLDMLGYNSVAPRAMNLFWRSAITGSEQIADLFTTVVTVYDLDLVPLKFDTLHYPLGNYSDNWSFWAQGYPAILVIEDSYGDFTPYYHRATDRIETLDMDYFRTLVQASVGTFAHMTGCLLGRADRRVWLPLVIASNRN